MSPFLARLGRADHRWICPFIGVIVLNEPHLTLHDGTPVLIRRLVAEDAALYPDFRSDVTAEDLRLRFFAPMREVSHELLDKLIHLGDCTLLDG